MKLIIKSDNLEEHFLLSLAPQRIKNIFPVDVLGQSHTEMLSSMSSFRRVMYW